MGIDIATIALYATPVVLLLVSYVRRHRAHHRESAEVLQENLEAGLTASASLHPIVDTTKCIGCGSCVVACPEMPGHQVLGMIRRKAHLISPTDCIGHGACESACPVDAITLVFGTSERGVDIPQVQSDFQTNIPGIYIAGELGGMGLIKNAVEQGKQAMHAIAARIKERRYENNPQVLIVGAGPSGIAATLAATDLGISYVTIEQDSLGGTVANFPKRKLVMTAPADLPIVGKVKFTETTKEALIEFWQSVEAKTGIAISYGERVESIDSIGDTFSVKTSTRTINTPSVLLAIGRRGTPRKLGVPGEELSKVTYRLVDPEQYVNTHVLIVGGGDSALEAAIAIADEPGTTVTLSYRSGSFNRAKKKNRERLQNCVDDGRLTVLLNSNVKSISEDHVDMDVKGEMQRIRNEAIIVNAGGILPTAFLREIGIEVETKYGTA